jgi:hypothetical protein
MVYLLIAYFVDINLLAKIDKIFQTPPLLVLVVFNSTAAQGESPPPMA